MKYLINDWFLAEAKNQREAWKMFEQEHALKSENTIRCIRRGTREYQEITVLNAINRKNGGLI
jgi:hypothetical protein